jgi:sulfide:quinone oxidoreductase
MPDAPLPHVVILGCGFGGLAAAKAFAGAPVRVTLIDRENHHLFQPLLYQVATAGLASVAIAAPIRHIFRRQRNVTTLLAEARAIDVPGRRVVLDDGGALDYDYLIIATGPKLAFDEVEGLGPGGHTQSVCHVDHAARAAEAWDAFVKDPGPIVVGAVQGASCFGPAYEFAFIMETDLRKRKLRDRVPMTFVTAEPYIGHLGLGGVGDSKGMLESAMRDKHIKWITNAKVTKVEAGKMHVTEHDDEGKPKKEHVLPFKYSMMLPAFKGIDAVFGIEGLTNPRGFILIDQYQRNPKYPNVYAVGVAVAIPPVEATPVPTGAPKTGYMIESMVTATAHNIRAAIDGRSPTEKATWNAVCLADMGDTGIAFVALPQIPPRNVNWFSEGKWVHLAKVAFEKYFIRKMKRGTSEPFYEKYVMKALGIVKLKKTA